MVRHVLLFLGAATLLAILDNSALADEPGQTVEFTTKLGVSRKVTLAANPVTSFDEIESSAFTLATKDGLSLVVPLYLVKSLSNTKEQTTLILADGSQHLGKLVGDPRLTIGDQDYDLAGIKQLSINGVAAVPKPDANGPAWTVTVFKPVEKTYSVFAPRYTTKVTTTVKMGKGGFNPGGGGPGGGGFAPGGFGSKSSATAAAAAKLNAKHGGRLSLTVDGEVLSGYLHDFERIEVMKQGDNWVMTVQAPQAAPVTGNLESSNWNLRWTTPAGYAVILSSDTAPTGFFLKKAKN